MWSSTRVQTLLDVEDLDYEKMKHADAFTALGTAAASRIPGREMAKAVVLRDEGGRYLMAVVPATCRLDLEALTWASGHFAIALATKEEIARLLPDCDPGAVPPFGILYDMPTFFDLCLCDVPEIYFTAGSRRELIGMRVADYVFAARPMLGQFCLHAGAEREAM